MTPTKYKMLSYIIRSNVNKIIPNYLTYMNNRHGEKYEIDMCNTEIARILEL